MHLTLKNKIFPPFPEKFKQIHFGMGCFWGVEKLFWNINGVWVTAVGYAGGFSTNPTYESVCNEETGHAEVVRVVYDPKILSLKKLLKVFWESHDPTQGMRQGNDYGSQYRSIILNNYIEDVKTINESFFRFQKILNQNGYNKITTEISNLNNFFYAEDYHQQYLAKNPNGYCSLSGLNLNLSI